MKDYTGINRAYATLCNQTVKDILNHTNELTKGADIPMLYYKVGEIVQFLEQTYLYKKYKWEKVKEEDYLSFSKMLRELTDFINDNLKTEDEYGKLITSLFLLAKVYYKITYNED